jgi:hypothetical protein
VADDLLDLAVGLEVLEGFPGERTVDLETIDEGGNGDQAVRLDILVELVGDVLVEDDGVLGLVLDCGACQLCILRVFVACAALRRVWVGGWFLGCAVLLCVRGVCVLAAAVTYPCPSTTSSSASCLRLLREPFFRMCEVDWFRSASRDKSRSKCCAESRCQAVPSAVLLDSRTTCKRRRYTGSVSLLPREHQHEGHAQNLS